MREEKKSESLEVRLSHSQKQAFMEACKADGLSASEALRTEIDDFLQSRSEQSQRNFQLRDVVTLMKRNIRKTLGTVSALAAGSLVLLALPSAANDEDFQALDRNGDGVLSTSEISANQSVIFDILDDDGNGEISAEEYAQRTDVTSVNDHIFVTEDGEEVRRVTVERASVDLDTEGEVVVSQRRWAEDIELTASEAEVEALIEAALSHLSELDSLSEAEHAARIEAMVNAEEISMEIDRAMAEVDRAMIIVRELDISGLSEEAMASLAELENIENLDNLEGLEGLAGLAVLGELGRLGELGNLERLAELEGLEALAGLSALSELENLHIELTDLENLEVELSELEGLGETIQAEILAALSELEEGETERVIIRHRVNSSEHHFPERPSENLAGERAPDTPEPPQTPQDVRPTY